MFLFASMEKSSDMPREKPEVGAEEIQRGADKGTEETVADIVFAHPKRNVRWNIPRPGTRYNQSSFLTFYRGKTDVACGERRRR